MKILLSFFLISNLAMAEQSCLKNPVNCREVAKSCEDFDICINRELDMYNLAVKKIINLEFGSLDNLEQCQREREDLENMIVAHATTIECFDTPAGPEFGG